MPSPTREQEDTLFSLAMTYDRVQVHGSIGDDLLCWAIRNNQAVAEWRITVDGRALLVEPDPWADVTDRRG